VGKNKIEDHVISGSKRKRHKQGVDGLTWLFLFLGREEKKSREGTRSTKRTQYRSMCRGVRQGAGGSEKHKMPCRRGPREAQEETHEEGEENIREH